MKIKKFVQFVNENLNEGGKVFDDTSKIDKESVGETVKDIDKNLFSFLGLKLGKNVIRIGSAGHADVSGDIDFGIIDADLDKLHELIKMKFPKNETNYLKGLEVLSVAWPISGTDSLVQVDLIPVYDKEWTEFIYRYPKGSSYKSAHRNWLIMAVLSAIKENAEKTEDGEIVSYDGYMLNLNKGLFSMSKDYHGKSGILKHGVITNKKLITLDPRKLVRFVFGKDYSPKDMETFEDCMNILNRTKFKWKDNLEQIKKNLKKFLKRVELEIPTELK